MTGIKMHVEVFVASRLLGERQGAFTPKALRREVQRLFGDTRAGVETHISAHCVANAPKNTGTVHNYLWRLEHGLLRVFDAARDVPHPSRTYAGHYPLGEDVPMEYRYLLPQDT
jgi:hypothetical protein